MDASQQLCTSTVSSDVEVDVRDKLSALRGCLGAWLLGVHTIESHHLWSLYDGVASTSGRILQEEVASIRQQIDAITGAAESPEDGRCAAESIVAEGEMSCQQLTAGAPSDTSPMVAQMHPGPDQQEQQHPQHFERIEEIVGAVEPPCKKFRRSEVGTKTNQDEEMSCRQLTTKTLSRTSPTLKQAQVELEQQEQHVEVAEGANEPPHKKLRRSADGSDLTCVESSGVLPCDYVSIASAATVSAADQAYRQKLVAITPLGRLSVGKQTEYNRQQQVLPPQDVRQLGGMAVAGAVPLPESVTNSGMLQYALAPFAPLYRFAVALKKRARPDADVA